MKKIKVKVVKLSDNLVLPKYETIGSAGMDVRANISEPLILGPLERKLIPLGIKIEIPEGYEVQVRPRSGLALKYGIGMANSIGTIDSDYRGEIGAILINLSKDEYVVQPQERIGQIILNKVEKIEWEVVESLDETERGSGGFGHTGK
ncbi:dUTP diphosphatase [Fusobacterium mortiferum]|uniref:Deoxyuridine 5'-triphosphate nucleotidohydrolase n=1 Tax=Fusobacterium mortiferum TaxID=850 RepID=A0ABS2G312_FUSMR|nr:dUTP diphosphatase [Fusobacterium mortiferum]MBM6875133.1 dUTP diphosphatase [Fusobacterium mortiferum]